MIFPPVSLVREELRCVIRDVDWQLAEDELEVRLQVMPDGSWSVHVGDPGYDTDHRGFWGASYLHPDSNAFDVASDLVAEAADDMAQADDGDTVEVPAESMHEVVTERRR